MKIIESLAADPLFLSLSAISLVVIGIMFVLHFSFRARDLAECRWFADDIMREHENSDSRARERFFKFAVLLGRWNFEQEEVSHFTFIQMMEKVSRDIKAYDEFVKSQESVAAEIRQQLSELPPSAPA